MFVSRQTLTLTCYFLFVPEPIKFGVSRLMEKSEDEEEDEDISNNNHSKTSLTLNGISSDVTTMTDGGQLSPSGSRSPSPELEVGVDSPPRSPPLEVTMRTPSPVTKSKKAEAFSVSALLRPDFPRIRKDPGNYLPFSETISVTRSFLYPGLPFSDILKEPLNSGLLPRHFLSPPGFPLGSGLYGPPKDGELDANKNLLTGSLYLSLGAVHAAAAAAMANSSVPPGKLTWKW